MNKIKYILMLLFCIFLISCESYYLDYSNINCSLDKTSYAVNENIVLLCKGFFGENDLKGYLAIEFYLNKIVNGEKLYGNRPVFTIENCGNLKNKACIENVFSAYILENTDFKEVDETIILKISEVGDYELHIMLIGYIKHEPIEQTKDFHLTFTVTE